MPPSTHVAPRALSQFGKEIIASRVDKTANRQTRNDKRSSVLDNFLLGGSTIGKFIAFHVSCSLTRRQSFRESHIEIICSRTLKF